MNRPIAVSSCFTFVALLSLVLTSCGSGVKTPPALDRATFIDETSIKLPSAAEILESKSSVDNQGVHYHVILKLPKSAEGVLPGPGIVDDPKFRTSVTVQLRQMDMTTLARFGVTLKDPNTPKTSYSIKTKSKGSGDAAAYLDGDTMYVLCNFGIQK